MKPCGAALVTELLAELLTKVYYLLYPMEMREKNQSHVAVRYSR
jgi:hypothetical protein